LGNIIKSSSRGAQRRSDPALLQSWIASLRSHDERNNSMAGHSQFKNIMHRKGRQDAAKSKLFGKLAREITVSAKVGIPDPEMNPRLRAAVIAEGQYRACHQGSGRRGR
jgi:hypothetical protein